MKRMKDFALWILAVVAFALFANGIIYMYLHTDELGGKIYNMTHKEEVVSENKVNKK
ncbi:MAG: hypothetical protein HFJ54_01625 [Clostridia bacterium]|nr:hypothetical protein [Clostridia bacterium]